MQRVEKSQAIDFLLNLLSDYTIGGVIGYNWEKWYCKTSFRGCCPDMHFLPIYGAGAVLSGGTPWWSLPVTVPLLEYFASKFWDPNRELWDYSQEKYNVDGRVSLRSAIGFGIPCAVISPILHATHNTFVSRTIGFYGLARQAVAFVASRSAYSQKKESSRANFLSTVATCAGSGSD